MTDAAYEQEADRPLADDYRALAADLRICRLDVYSDAAVMLFHAEKQFPNMVISCQLDDDLAIEDWDNSLI